MVPLYTRIEAGLRYVLARLPEVEAIYSEQQRAVEKIGSDYLAGQLYMTSTTKKNGKSYARYLYSEPLKGKAVQHVKKADVPRFKELTKRGQRRRQALALQNEIVTSLRPILNATESSIRYLESVLDFTSRTPRKEG